MNLRAALNTFFLPEDAHAFARSLGWQDAEQMCYYEEMREEAPMNDRDVQEMVERGAHADEIARAMGYESAQAITDELNRLEREEAERQATGTVEFLAPPPTEILVFQQEVRDVVQRAEQMRLAELASIHEAARQYELARAEQDEACPLRAWYDTSDELAGVY